ncbi:hypothetical protein N0O92_00405 [Alkalihalobacillus sp. MEB130]|uniref:hypothetical protein n=1 Tax=Alkalihalobacillus sp. MEB130 TaxID=2976704 RepID=UPI0028DF463F|nr:hypothetical protein [Alkalihalobacillus sp. MEB130]MDT8858669.1 hypothetical protein [Alkalihalobacillus sp. MEB130]
MENHKEFTVQNHYLVEIEQTRGVVSSDNFKTWSWDIYIARNEQEQYRGRALAPGKGIEIPWMELSKEDVLEEMISICEQQMPKNR